MYMSFDQNFNFPFTGKSCSNWSGIIFIFFTDNFKPRYVASALMDSTLESSIESVSAERIPMEELVLAPDVDIVLAGTGGGAGLVPTIEALKVGNLLLLLIKRLL